MNLEHLNDNATQMAIIRLRSEVPRETGGLTDEEILAFTAVIYSSVSIPIYDIIGAPEFTFPPIGQLAFRKFAPAFISAYLPMLLRKGIVNKVGIMAGSGVAEQVDSGATRSDIFDS